MSILYFDRGWFSSYCILVCNDLWALLSELPNVICWAPRYQHIVSPISFGRIEAFILLPRHSWVLSEVHDISNTDSGPMDGSFGHCGARVSYCAYYFRPVCPGTENCVLCFLSPSLQRVFLQYHVVLELSSVAFKCFYCRLTIWIYFCCLTHEVLFPSSSRMHQQYTLVLGILLSIFPCWQFIQPLTLNWIFLFLRLLRF